MYLTINSKCSKKLNKHEQSPIYPCRYVTMAVINPNNRYNNIQSTLLILTPLPQIYPTSNKVILR